MDKQKVQELENVIESMDIPFYRKTIRSHDSVRWLSRNLHIRNEFHKNFPTAKNLIMDILKCKKEKHTSA